MPILPEVQKALEGLVREVVALDIDAEKTYQYAEMRRVQLYWDGQQYVYPTYTNGIPSDYVPLSPYEANYRKTGDSREAEYGRYDSVLNLIRGDGNKLLAVLGVRAPTPSAEPLVESNEEQRSRAGLVQKILLALKRKWPTEDMQYQLALSAWKDGTFFLHTPWEESAEKNGTSLEPQFEQRQVALPPMGVCTRCGEVQGQMGVQCPNCGGTITQVGDAEQLPGLQEQVSVGVQRVPIGCPGLYKETGATVTTPFFATSLEDTPFLIHQIEAHKSILLASFPQLQMDDASCGERLFYTDEQGRINRQYQQQPHIGARLGTRPNLWVYTRVWLRPEMFHMLGKGKEMVKQTLLESYPQGVCLHFVGARLVNMQGERIQDVWSFGKPGVTDYIWCPPLAREFLPFQDCVNVVHNLFIEIIERSIGFTIFDPDMFSAEALANRPGMPNELLPAVPGVGGRLADAFYSVRGSEIEPQVQNWVLGQINMGREITGMQAPIFGGDAGNQTATEAEMRRNQALQQLGLIWAGMIKAWVGAYTNGVKLLVKQGAQALRRLGIEVLDEQEVAEILDHDGKLNGVAISIDEGIPTTWGALRDTVMRLLSMGPDTWNLVGLGSPSNSERLHKAIGLANWITPGAGAYNYVMEIIQELLSEPPMILENGGFQATIPFDEQALDPQEAILLVKDWLLGDEGRQYRRQAMKMGQPTGYHNVLAWSMQAQTLLQQAMVASAEPASTGQPEEIAEDPGVEVPPFQVQ